ncbi:MAG: hypothetical protein IK038_09080 [Bacteroidaceae bacterium]|nr:hypothetical protein [Bacteroidaceae bacterium]
MKKNLLALLLWIVVFGVESCSKKLCYRYEISEIDIDSVTCEVLKGTLLPLNMTDVDAFYCIDSLLLIHRTAYFLYPYEVYNKQTFDSITGFGRKGRARNEFLSNPVNYTKQTISRNGDVIIPLMDGSICKELNFNKTMETRFPVIEGTREGVHYYSGSAVLYGNDYKKTFSFIDGHGDDMYDGAETLPRFIYTDEKENRKEFCVYSRYPDNPAGVEEIHSFYSGLLLKRPGEDIVAQPLNRMSYVLYYDLDKRKYHAVHVRGAKTFDDGIPSDEQELMIRSFLDDGVVTKDFLLVVYYGNDIIKMGKTDPDYRGRILMLDWDGNLIKTYILHNWVNKFAFDSTNNVLYGANPMTGELFSFDLN